MGAATLSWRAVSADIRAVRCLPIVVASLINSADSRVFGPIPVAQVRGRAVVVAYSSGPDGVRWDRILSAVE